MSEEVTTSQIKELNELNRNFRECFNSKAGKRVLAYLKESFHVRTTTIRGLSDKGMVEGVLYSEGQRTVVLEIMDRIEQKDLKQGGKE